MFVSVRGEKKGRGRRGEGFGSLQEGPDCTSNRTGRGFAGRGSGQAFSIEALEKELRLGRRAGSVKTFENDKVFKNFLSVHFMSWYPFKGTYATV